MKINLKSKKLFLLDMDGTLYLDNTLFEGTIKFLNIVKSNGGRCVYLTNNSSKGVNAYIDKMNKMGISTTSNDYVTSVDATIAYLKSNYRDKLCYVLGTQSFFDQLTSAGIRCTQRLSDEIEILVMGFDTELTFKKLEDACILLKNDIPYIAANPDWVCPTAFGYVPDCGSVALMLKNATGKWPVFIGKPETAMIELAMKKFGACLEETVLVGDRVYTDIAAGNNAGIDTVMVLSGEGTVEETVERQIFPSLIVDDISVLADMIAESL